MIDKSDLRNYVESSNKKEVEQFAYQLIDMLSDKQVKETEQFFYVEVKLKPKSNVKVANTVELDEQERTQKAKTVKKKGRPKKTEKVAQDEPKQQQKQTSQRKLNEERIKNFDKLSPKERVKAILDLQNELNDEFDNAEPENETNEKDENEQFSIKYGQHQIDQTEEYSDDDEKEEDDENREKQEYSNPTFTIIEN